MTTPPPVSEERMRELVEHNNLLADDRKTSRGADSVLGEQYRHAAMAMTELIAARTTIAALRKEVATLHGDLNIARLQRDAKLCSECPRVAEVDELRRDALRYRWLRHAGADSEDWYITGVHVDGSLTSPLCGDELAAAIDAQLQPLGAP